MSKETNNVINFDGVRYELSPTDYDLVSDHIKSARQILASRGRILSDQATKSEKLNDAVVKKLIGHTDVVYYNFETKAWNTGIYNGYAIDSQGVDTREALNFKAAMEKTPEFKVQYEMAASVTMTIDRKFYPGRKKAIRNPQYSNKGTAVVGNIIVKNKTTGRYELYCKSWVGVDDFFFLDNAVDGGARGFANDGAWVPAFRAALLAAHVR